MPTLHTTHDIRNAVDKAVSETPVLDVHTPLYPPALGDIRDEGLDENPGLRFDVTEADLNGELGPVIASANGIEAEVHRPGAGIREELCAMSDIGSPETLRHEDLKGCPEQLIPMVTEHMLGLGVNMHDAAVAIDNHDGH